MSTTYGVISACDDGFFPGFQFLANSLARKAQVLLFDLGLSAQYKRWCFARGVAVCPVPAACPIQRDVPFWQSWNKPWYIEASPFDVTLWIDADCIVIGDIRPLFERVTARPLVVAHPAGASYLWPNAEKLYDQFPVPRRFKPHQTVNAGVLGFSKSDTVLLKAWQGMVEKAKDPDVRNLITWGDEGALHWALQAAQAGDCIVDDRPGWNAFFYGEWTLAEFALMLAGDKINTVCHFSSRPKYWEKWKTDQTSIFFS